MESTMSFSDARLVEHENLKCFVRDGTADEVIFRENIVQAGLFKHLKVEAGQNWIDLGAFIGTFALLLRSHGARVFSVEPTPENAKWLKRNLQLNGYPDVYVLEAAVLSNPKTDTLPLYLATPSNKIRGDKLVLKGVSNPAANTLFNRWKRPHPTIEVPVISFAKCVLEAKKVLLASKSWNLKMDIEGAEVDILENDDLADFDQIYFEYHYQAGGGTKRARKAIKRLKDLGFKVELSHPVQDPIRWFRTNFIGWATKP